MLSPTAPHRMQAKTVYFKPGERNIFFHILTACNLSCRHCYINPDEHGTATLSLATIRDWLALFHQPGKTNNLILLGGEPTLHPDLAPAIKEARQIGYDSITVDTNGYLFHHLLDRITPEDAVLSFSLDGPEPLVNDPLRGEGSFAVCTENLVRAVHQGFRVSVIFTASRLNLAHLHRMPDLLTKLGVARFFIQVIGLRGKSARDSEALQLTHEEWLDVVPAVAAQAAAAGMEVIFPKVFLEPGEPFDCAGRVAENFFIFPNGRVYQCPLCEDLPINTFSIVDHTLRRNSGLVEAALFSLDIPEGCVMNKLLQPDNIACDQDGAPLYRISCCMLKQQLAPKG